MKRLVFLVLVCMAMVVRAQVGTSCTNPYVVNHNFETYVPAGTHWFTAGTHDLPLYVTFEPDTFLLDVEKYESEDDFFADSILCVEETVGKFRIIFKQRMFPSRAKAAAIPAIR